jgi:hypothetical protein
MPVRVLEEFHQPPSRSTWTHSAHRLDPAGFSPVLGASDTPDRVGSHRARRDPPTMVVLTVFGDSRSTWTWVRAPLDRSMA